MLFGYLLMSGLWADEPVYESWAWGIFPEDGAVEVPIDAAIVVQDSGFYDFQITKDQQNIAFQTEALHSSDFRYNQSRSTWTLKPFQELEPNQEYVVWANEEELFRFTTGTEMVSGIHLDPPVFDFEYYQKEDDSPAFCPPSPKITTVYTFTFESSEDGLVVDESNTNHMILIYKRIPGSIFFHETVAQNVFSGKEYDVDNSGQACFVAAYVNTTGEIGEYSDVVCREPKKLYKPEGCSSTSSNNLSWLSLGFGLVGLLRRRKGGNDDIAVS